MTTTTTNDPDTPQVHFWAVPDLTGLDFDPLLAKLLHEDPVTRVRLPHGEGHAWLVTRYEDVKFVSVDPRFSRQAVWGRSITRVAPHFIPMEGAVGFADPPDHTRMRRVVARAFSARALRSLRDHAQDVMDRLLDRVEEHGAPADLMELVNRPFPLAMVSELMGVPEGDQPLMAHWSDTIISAGAGREASETAKAEMGRYFTELIGRNHGTGKETLAAVLADAVDDDTLTEHEAVGLAVLIQIGGAHAVRNNSANMVYALLTHPEHLARLRAEPELVPQAVDELLRYIPHRNAVGLSRIALEDVEVGGVTIPSGDPVYVSYLTANRDPAVFPDPERLDFDRAYNPHVAFGHGPHYCPGSALARIESEILVDTLWTRFPNLRLAVPEDQLRWQRGALIRGPETLPVTW
ncbi:MULTISPECIES: cytochrome P450 [Streptomyces]|uniref:Putative cytochrome P450 hydroxylase n=1 Tax=Streptomyces venezuelae (strain ATCC 10712 / CBS 650.69 / DSM 40230 / JCM 4526 / NBRC 13096 / PD 04745) TaxID=953739 RepID=F2R5R8_STRVP|nr:cytochrome P450 [Streptomyces venezuelae]APE19779.1 cytochrome [Streptomyces venezuelae]QER97186.1 cytochrome P450 [Streptomyces venezuelae ATCC 10712]QES16882.1 cytochrome P450 [Streptomyces venezuelae]CCA53579.1 putative cytochrome P450 hydroxylase [Streptomyces venezuelae ATCC 10712]